MKRYVRLTHNGMDVTFHNTVADALNHIEAYMSNASVSHHKISDSIVKVENDTEDFCNSMRVIVYQYCTLYMEVFVIKEV